MRLREKAVIYGDAVTAAALGQVLSLLGVEYCISPLLEELEARTRDSRKIVAVNEDRKRHLTGRPLVIAFATSYQTLPNIIRLVHALRSDETSQWEGGFLAIVPSADSRMRLMEMDLLGDPQSRYAFGNVEGHAAISQPLLLADLLLAVKELNGMYSNQWNLLVHSSPAWSIPALVRRAEGLIDSTASYKKALTIVRRLISLACQVEWRVLLADPHKDLPSINELCSMLSSMALVNVSQCKEATNMIKLILSKTCIKMGA